MTAIKLPPLPRPYCPAHEDAGCEYPDMWYAYQVEAYARQAVAAALEFAAGVCEGMNSDEKHGAFAYAFAIRALKVED